MSVATLLVLLAAGLLAAILLDHQRLARALRGRRWPRRLERYPSVTIIRPIRGLDVGADENVRVALDNGYPGDIQTLFVFDDESEPAIPIVRDAIARHEAEGGHGTAQIVFCGAPPSGLTGKLNAMLAGLRRAHGELVGFVDSDVRAHRDVLRVVVETLLEKPDTGAAFAPVVVTDPPRTVGDVGYAALLNGLYGPSMEATVHRSGGTLPFIMGQFMVFRRAAIEAIGGLESAHGQLVDDMYLGARVHSTGWRNRVAPCYAAIIQSGLGLSEFKSLFTRWIIFSRTGLSGLSVRIEGIVRATSYWAGMIGGVGAALMGQFWPALLFLLAPIGVAESINRLHERLGGGPVPWRLRWATFVLLLAAPVVYVRTLTRRRMSWRGREYGLGSDARLDDQPASGEVRSRT